MTNQFEAKPEAPQNNGTQAESSINYLSVSEAGASSYSNDLESFNTNLTDSNVIPSLDIEDFTPLGSLESGEVKSDTMVDSGARNNTLDRLDDTIVCGNWDTGVDSSGGKRNPGDLEGAVHGEIESGNLGKPEQKPEQPLDGSIIRSEDGGINLEGDTGKGDRSNVNDGLMHEAINPEAVDSPSNMKKLSHLQDTFDQLPEGPISDVFDEAMEGILTGELDLERMQELSTEAAAQFIDLFRGFESGDPEATAGWESLMNAQDALAENGIDLEINTDGIHIGETGGGHEFLASLSVPRDGEVSARETFRAGINGPIRHEMTPQQVMDRLRERLLRR